MKLLILTGCILLGAVLTTAADQLDSIRALIRTAEEDTAKVGHLDFIASIYFSSTNYTDAERCYLASLELAERLGWLKGLETAHGRLVQLYSALGDRGKRDFHQGMLQNLHQERRADTKQEPVQESKTGGVARAMDVRFLTLLLLLPVIALLAIRLVVEIKTRKRIQREAEALRARAGKLEETKSGLETAYAELTAKYHDLEEKFSRNSGKATIGEQSSGDSTALGELEAALEAARQEEKNLEDTLAKAKKEAGLATGWEREIKNDKVRQVEQKLLLAMANRARLITLAHQTKSGFTYTK